MSRRIFFAVLLIAPLFATATTFAQSAKKNGTVITGTVLGADGKPVRAAAVTCQSSAGIRPRVVHTDSKGHFIVTGLKQDSYDLRATSNGAYSDWEKNIPLRTGQTKQVTLRLLNGNTAISGTLPAKRQN
jgi:Carboxypeptidase regulatory-like domain